MRVTCENGHEVCTVPDELGWEIHSKNFIEWAENQRPIEEYDFIFSIPRIRNNFDLFGEGSNLPGMCWCGAPYAGFTWAHGYFVIHTTEGWIPKMEEDETL